MLQIKNKIAKMVLVVLCILFCNGITHKNAFPQDANLKIIVYDGLIDLYAANVKFDDLLDAISQKTGIEFSTEIELSDNVHCDFKKIEIETAIRNLIRNKGYDSAIFYLKDTNGNFVVTKVQIGIGDKKPVRQASKPHVRASDDSIKTHSNEFTNNWYKAQFKDTGKLLKQIDVEPLSDELKGIRLETVKSPSVFADLGLSQGDVITNINNQPVRTKDDLIKSLNPKLLPSWIRIERKNAQQQEDPIYIRLTGIKPGAN